MTLNHSLVNYLPPASEAMAQPVQLTGYDIGRFAKLFGLHLTEVSMALGINTAALYTKQRSTDPLSSSVAILIRLYSAFPDHLPRVRSPEIEAFMSRIIALDGSFKRSHLGPLLGLETNSSFRLHKGADGASQTVRQLLTLIDKLLDENPAYWSVIKDAVEIEAHASSIIPAKNVWTQGGWSKGRSKVGKDKPTAKKPRISKSTSAKPLIRRTQEAQVNEQPRDS